ncbi:hypothetical protein DFH11DRAFT_1725474 [Phellopilus nigrolimitatus]|nr:hypothetical protein DFH11DRAFT_1725474 [Phellopilus nigrolimitatus]
MDNNIDISTDGNAQHPGGQNDPPGGNLQQRLGGQNNTPVNPNDTGVRLLQTDSQNGPPANRDGTNNAPGNGGVLDLPAANVNAAPPDLGNLNASLQLRQNSIRDFSSSMQQTGATIQQQIAFMQNRAVQNMRNDQIIFKEILAQLEKLDKSVDTLTDKVGGLETAQKETTNELGDNKASLKTLTTEQSYTSYRLQNNTSKKGYLCLPPPKNEDGSAKPWPRNNPFPTSPFKLGRLSRAKIVEWLEFYNCFVDPNSSTSSLRNQFARFIGVTGYEDADMVGDDAHDSSDGGGGAGGGRNNGSGGGGPDGRGPPGGGGGGGRGGHPFNDVHRNSRHDGPRDRGRGGGQSDNDSDDHRSDESQTSGDRRRDRQSASEEEEESQNPSARKRKRQQPPTAQAGKKATPTATTKKTGKKTSKTTTQATAQQEVPQNAPETSRPKRATRQAMRTNA